MYIFFEADGNCIFETDKVSMNKKDIRMYKGIGVLLILWGIIMLVQAAFGEEEADAYWLVPEIRNNYESRWIPVYYVYEDFFCENHPTLARGCYVLGPTEEYIMINKNVEFEWANQGCTVHDHEWFHAMGWGHGMGPLDQTCTEFGKMISPARGTNPTGVYADPMYVHVPREMDPRSIRWN